LESHFVAQADLELLGSSDSSTLNSPVLRLQVHATRGLILILDIQLS
jgi:hypothetical protein